MFLWGQAVQLPPEAQVVHEGRGNQEHQQYQEHPKKEINWNCDYRTVVKFIYLEELDNDLEHKLTYKIRR